jgi:aspartyl-tRNA(Asn)/glutamyl-tRNA(Gln) amidotransferase subunit B
MVEQWFNKEYINTLISSKEILDYYTVCINAWSEPKLVAKRMCWPMMSKIEISWLTWLTFTQPEFINFLQTISTKNTPDYQVKQIFEIFLEQWWDVNEVILQLWFDQTAPNNWDDLIGWIISANQKVVDEYKWWKLTAIWFLVWQVMRQAGWKIDPNEAKRLLEEKIR